jgi:hypothetical protein
MQTKTLLIWSSIIVIVFLILLGGLRVFDVVSIAGFITGIFVVAILFVGVAVINGRSEARKSEGGIPEKKGQGISKERAQEIAQELREGRQFSEYERDVILDEVWKKGDQNTPVYVRLSIGEFDNTYLGCVVNMADPQNNGIREYPITTDVDTITADMHRRANLVAVKPKPDAKFRTTESIDPLTDRRVITKEPIENYTATEEKGGLQ